MNQRKKLRMIAQEIPTSVDFRAHSMLARTTGRGGLTAVHGPKLLSLIAYSP